MGRLQRRNEKRKKLSDAHYKKRQEIKKEIKNPNIPVAERSKMIFDLRKKRDCSKVRVRRRCSITDRPRGVYRDFDMCRNMIRHYLGFGLIPGARKKSTG